MHLSMYLNNANSFPGRVVGGTSEILFPIGKTRLARDIYGNSYKAKVIKKQIRSATHEYLRFDDAHKLESSMRQAMARGKERQFLFNNEYKQILKDVHHEMLETRNFDDLFVGDLPGEVMVAQMMLRYCRTEPLKESQEQVVCCLRFYDSLGRRNISQLRCRWGELQPKLKRYSYNIDGWTGVYLEWQGTMQMLRFEFMNQLERFRKIFLACYQNILNGRKIAQVQKAMIRQRMIVGQWKTIKPYSNFPSAILPILDEAIDCIGRQQLGKCSEREYNRLQNTALFSIVQCWKYTEVKQLQMKLVGLDLFLSDKKLSKVRELEKGKVVYSYPFAVSKKLREATTAILDQLKVLDDHQISGDLLKTELWKIYMSTVKGWEASGFKFRKNEFTRLNQHDKLRELLKDMISKITELRFTPRT